METKRIKIMVTEKVTKEGKKFNTYKTTSKNGRLIDVKFRKDVKDLPTKTCYATIDVDCMNLDKNREYPVLWVNDVVGYDELAEVNKEKNKAELDEIFG